MNDYLPNLKLLGQTILELHVLVAKGIEINNTFGIDLCPTDLNIKRYHLLVNLPSLKLVGQSVLELSLAQGEVDWDDL